VRAARKDDVLDRNQRGSDVRRVGFGPRLLPFTSPFSRPSGGLDAGNVKGVGDRSLVPQEGTNFVQRM
jgi:hypothetical protein